MPWCDDCARFWNPTSMREGGECPTCGRVIAESKEMKAPWHFKLLVVATVLYLAFRAYQGVAWLIAR
jgi:hypothetical protein